MSWFARAGPPAWTPPGDDELREHFDDGYLGLVRPETPRAVRAEVGGLRFEAAAQAAPPHRLSRLRVYPLGQRVTDPRVASPPSRAQGPVPAAAAAVAAES